MQSPPYESKRSSQGSRNLLRSCPHGERLESRCLFDAGALSCFNDLPTFNASSRDFEFQDVLNTASYDPGSILVRFVSEEVANDPISVLIPGAKLSDPLALLPGLRRVTFPGDVPVCTALDAFSHDPSVVYAEPNYYFFPDSLTPDDPDFDRTWGLHNTGQSDGTLDADIDAPEAWDFTTGDPSVIVAVLDSGIDLTHPDLAKNVWINPGEIPNDLIDNDGNGFIDDVRGWDFVNADNDPSDDHGHGTHISGILGAIGDNNVGIAGVAWNTQLMPLKVLSVDSRGSAFAAAQALDYAVMMGATVSNNSYGKMLGNVLSEAIAAAGDAGHVFVASAGNENEDTDENTHLPSSFSHENIIAVTATGPNDVKRPSSNFGAVSVDLGAPGSGIYSTSLSGEYTTMSGTSQATPFVTGTVALVQSLRPDWGVDQVKNAILDTVDPIESLQGITVSGGRLNAGSAVAAAYPTGPAAFLSTNGRNIAGATADFGTVVHGMPKTLTFTVNNVGRDPTAANLDLGPMVVPDGFTVVSDFGTSSLAAGESTSFSVRLDADRLGKFRGRLSFDTNQLGATNIDVQLTGAVVTFVPQIVDNGEPGFTAHGSPWLDRSEGFKRDASFNEPGSGGADTATWMFSVEPGVYQVAATWPAQSFWARNAPFTVNDGATPIETVLVDQTIAPNDFSDEGATWEILGEFKITSDSLSVNLSDDADLEVLADAIRVQKMADLATVEIVVGNHVLLPDTPEQPIQIHVTGGRAVQGLNFNAQMDLGGPAIQDVDILVGTIFAGNNTRTVDLDGSHPDSQLLWEGRSTTTASGKVLAEGLLATVTLDTTGLFSGTWQLDLDGTQNGDTDFSGIDALVTGGSVTIVPLDGDFDGDGSVNSTDVEILFSAIRMASADPRFDLDNDAMVAESDLIMLVQERLDIPTRQGDANFDGRVDFDDFVSLAKGFGGGSPSWESGDFNADGEVEFDDFVLLATSFGFGG